MDSSSRDINLSELEWLISEGISVIPLKPDGSKEPLIKWKEFQERKPTPEEITLWKEQTNNFAAVCGAVSGNLTIIDIDHAELFEKLNLGEVAAKTKTDKTPHGYHIWLRTETLRNDKNLEYEGTKEIEFKSNNALVTIASSVNEDGIRYEHFLTSPQKIATVPDGFFSDLEKIYNDYRQTGKKGFGSQPRGVVLKGSGILKIITAFAGELNELVDHGDYLTCRCPFPKHEDKHPSFTIYPATNSYYCFTCNKGGNVINFVSDFLGISIKKAREKLEEQGWIEERKEQDGEKEILKQKAHFEKDGRLYLEILTTDKQYKFAYFNNGKVELADAVEDVLPVELPYTREGEIAFIVKLPDEDIASCEVLEPDELLDRIKVHIRKYCDMPDMDTELCAFYTLFTWFYKKTNTVGYLRFIADTGKGKSRMVTVVSEICFYPTSTGGSSSFSGLMRTNERWHGTTVMDESDMAGEKESQVIKYLNAGFEAGKYFMLSDKKDPKRQEVFDPFMPKIIGVRENFRDMATEGRLLSITPHERTDEDIPIILKKEYYEETRKLRNTIARFVLARWHDVDGEKMLEFKGMGIEPRLQQLAMPLSIIFQLWNGGKETFKEYILSRQKELKKTRAQSWHGSMFNLVYAVAIGDEEFAGEYGLYYNPDGEIEAVIPSMIAKAMNTTPKTATSTLRSIGFDVELRYITQHIQIGEDEREEKRKRVRAYVVPDERTWEEIVQRYHYDEESENTHIEIPGVFKSKKYVAGVHRTVPSVPSVPKGEDESKSGTDRTDGTDGTLHGTQTSQKNKPEKPTRFANIDDVEKDGTIRPEAFDKDFQAKQSKEARERLEKEGFL